MVSFRFRFDFVSVFVSFVSFRFRFGLVSVPFRFGFGFASRWFRLVWICCVLVWSGLVWFGSGWFIYNLDSNHNSTTYPDPNGCPTVIRTLW